MADVTVTPDDLRTAAHVVLDIVDAAHHHARQLDGTQDGLNAAPPGPGQRTRAAAVMAQIPPVLNEAAARVSPDRRMPPNRRHSERPPPPDSPNRRLDPAGPAHDHGYPGLGFEVGEVADLNLPPEHVWASTARNDMIRNTNFPESYNDPAVQATDILVSSAACSGSPSPRPR